MKKVKGNIQPSPESLYSTDLQQRMKTVKGILQSFFESPYSVGLQIIMACIFTSGGLEVAGLLVFAVFITLILFICDDLFLTFQPFMLISMTVLKCYDSFDTFIKIVPLAVVPVAAFVYYFLKHRRKLKIGKSFWGIILFSFCVSNTSSFFLA